MIIRTARRALQAWQMWTQRRRLYAADPTMRELRLQLAKQRKRHGQTKSIERELCDRMTTRLRREVGI